MRNRFECLVLGGGIAGSAAAYHLAQQGYHVGLLEKARGPHHKVCGEFLSFEALSYLHEMGIMLNSSFPVIKYFQMISPQSQMRFKFPCEGRGISRFRLDECLLSQAQKAGVHVYRGVCMKQYVREDGMFTVRTNQEDFYAPYLFLATGKHDANKEGKRYGQDDSYLGIKTHLYIKSKEFKETTALFSFSGGYGGVCPVEEGRVNFCFVIKKNIYRSLHGDFKKALSFLQQSNPRLNEILSGSVLIEKPCAIGYIPYGFLRSKCFEDGVYFLGDQRMVIPSFTGDGMAIALGTAKDCVDEFTARQKGEDWESAITKDILNRQMRWACLGQFLLNSFFITELCMAIEPCGQFLIKTFFEKTRISKNRIYEHTLNDSSRY